MGLTGLRGAFCRASSIRKLRERLSPVDPAILFELCAHRARALGPKECGEILARLFSTRRTLHQEGRPRGMAISIVFTLDKAGMEQLNEFFKSRSYVQG